MLNRVLILVIALGAPLAQADDISGFWKHTEAPGWIEISLEFERIPIIGPGLKPGDPRAHPKPRSP